MLELWAIRRRLYRTKWRYRRAFGVIWLAKMLKAQLGRSEVVHSTTILKDDTTVCVSSVTPLSRHQRKALKSS